MVWYFYSWTPLVIVGTVVLLSLPWLGLIALVIFSLGALAALAALAWAIVFVPYMLGRAISRHWLGRSGAPQRSTALGQRVLDDRAQNAFAADFHSRRRCAMSSARSSSLPPSSTWRSEGSARR